MVVSAEDTARGDLTQLREENDLLRQEMLNLFLEEQEQLFVVKPNLLRLELITIGAWVLRLTEADMMVRRLRRKVEEIQSAMRGGRPVQLDEIDRLLDDEFAEGRQRIRAQADAVAGARRNLDNLMSDADAAEFRKLYRDLVARFHPDLAGGLSTDERLLWDRLQRVYERGDLGGLRTLALLARSIIPAAPEPDVVPLQAEQERLRGLVRQLMQRLAELRLQHPFALEKLLNDSAWVSQRRGELSAETVVLEAQAAALEIRLAKLLPAMNHVLGFGPN